MDISVVVPAFNSRDKLRCCLRSLARCEADRALFGSVQLIVVDDGSDDGTGAMVAALGRSLELDYVFVPRTAASCRSAARNAGIGRAEGDVVVMVDADQVVGPGFLNEHARYHRAGADMVVVGRRVDLAAEAVEDLSSLPPMVRDDSREAVYQRFSYNLNNLATCWHHLFTCNVSVPRRHLEAVGGFDESFTGWGLEDVELGYRLRRHGLAFAYNRAAITHHLGRRRVTDQMHAEWRNNLARFVNKHPDPQVPLQSAIGRIYERAAGGPTWLDVMTRFEYASRALHGRPPTPGPFDIVDVDDTDLDFHSANLSSRAAETNLAVFDHSENARMGPLVQNVETDRDLLYFPRPTAAKRDRQNGGLHEILPGQQQPRRDRRVPRARLHPRDHHQSDPDPGRRRT
jgi:GT2 family glycosyltransferase